MGQSEQRRSDLDVFRASHALIAKLGPGAPGYAARHAHELLKVGDMEGYGYWNRIRLATHEQLALGARHNEPVEDKTAKQGDRDVKHR